VWLLLYVATALLVFAAAQFMTLPHFGMPRHWSTIRTIFHDLRNWKWREGLWFAISPSTQVVNNDADKFMLARLANPSQAGIYGAAYRVLSAAFLPVQALLTMTYPRFFREGGHGIHHSGRYAWRWLPAALGYSLGAAGLIFAGAPLVVKLLGSQFRDTAFVLRQLAILPALKAVQFLFADSLSGADFQSLRVLLQAGAAALNVALNLLWMPELGWHGAVRATLVCDGALAAGLVLAQFWLRRVERRASQFA
jgi:O-antigen/teichoic acid export membrane protein